MTLLEAIIVLAIAGVISAVLLIIAKMALDKNNISKLSQSLTTMQAAVISTYRNKTSYPEATNYIAAQKLSNALVLLGKMSKSDMINPFSDEEMAIFTTGSQRKQNRAYVIKIGKISQEKCRLIVTTVSDQFEYIQVEPLGRYINGDIYIDPNASAVSGVIKSPKGGPDSFDITNFEHMSALCGGEAGVNNYYDIFIGGR